MSAEKLTQRAFLAAAIALNDLLHIVDVSDTSQSPQGSSYKMTAQQLAGYMKKAGMGNWNTVAPTVNDDSTQGYVNGAFWFDENAQKFYILNDNSAGAAAWVLFDLQFAYDGGNVVNGADVIINAVGNLLGIGSDVLTAQTGTNVNAFGFRAALGNSGDNINAFGSNSADNNSGSHVNSFGNGAGNLNTSDDCNFFGRQAGAFNTTSFGVTVFSNQSVPSYANQAAADAALTVANGCVAGQVYIYRNEANDTIGFVIPA